MSSGSHNRVEAASAGELRAQRDAPGEFLADAPIIAADNVVPFTRLRRGAASASPEVPCDPSQRPAPHFIRDRGRLIIPLLALSLLVHGGLYMLFNRAPPPMASIGVEVMSVEIVLGANTPAGAAAAPGENETQSAPADAPKPVETDTETADVKAQQPEMPPVEAAETADVTPQQPETPPVEIVETADVKPQPAETPPVEAAETADAKPQQSETPPVEATQATPPDPQPVQEPPPEPEKPVAAVEPDPNPTPPEPTEAPPPEKQEVASAPVEPEPAPAPAPREPEPRETPPPEQQVAALPTEPEPAKPEPAKPEPQVAPVPPPRETPRERPPEAAKPEAAKPPEPKPVRPTEARPKERAVKTKQERNARPKQERAQRTASLDPNATGPRANAASGVGLGSSQARSNYDGLVSAHLRRYQRYPDDARSRGEQGGATVRFALDGGGRVTSVGIVRRTGFASLDQEAQSMVRRASPFPAPPDGRGRSFTVPVSFRMPR